MLHGSERVNMKKKRKKHIRKERESGMKNFICKIDVLCNTLSTFVHVNRETRTSNYLRKTNTQRNHNSYKQGILTNRHLSPSTKDFNCLDFRFLDFLLRHSDSKNPILH